MNLKQAVTSVLGVPEVPGSDEWPTRCLSPDHDDQNPSASVNVAKGVWYCQSCGRGGRIETLLGDTKLDEPTIAEMVKDSEALLAEIESRAQVRYYPESWLSLFQAREAHPYWISRGYTVKTVEKWRLGYDYESGRVTYPMRDNKGRVLGVVRRALDDSKPKYLYPKHVDKAHHLFGYHEARKQPLNQPLVVVEGATSVFTLDQDGLLAVGTYGWAMSPQQERLIRNLHPSEVIIAYDMDEAGETGRQRVLYGTSLCEALPVRCAVWDPRLAKGLDELPPEIRNDVLEGADFLV